MNERLLERIKKMFTLANDPGAAEGEAENAMRMANKLLEKHNLNIADLHTSDAVTIKFEDGVRNVWVKHLYNCIAPVYSCGFFVQGSEQCLLVGTESDTVTASIVIHGLIENINRAGKGKGVGFKNGAVMEISRQCKEIIVARKASPVISGTGLVLSKVYDAKYDKVREMMESLNLGKGRRNNMTTTNEGRAYGATLNPHAHMSNRKALN